MAGQAVYHRQCVHIVTGPGQHLVAVDLLPVHHPLPGSCGGLVGVRKNTGSRFMLVFSAAG